MRVRGITIGILFIVIAIAGCSSGDETTETTVVDTQAASTTTTTEPPLDLQVHAERLMVGIQSEGDFLELDAPGFVTVGSGTGVVIADDGLILTTATSVVGADRINVFVPGEEFPLVGEIDSAAECANLALVRIDHAFDRSVELAANTEPTAVAAANRHTILSGPISATISGDSFTISGGPTANAGAAVFDSDGGLAGIVTGFSDAGRPVALRSAVAAVWVRQLRSREIVEQLGFAAVSNTQGQAVVAAVDPSGPAAVIGLDVGDVVTSADGIELVDGVDQLCDLIEDGGAALEVVKDGRRHVGSFPDVPLVIASARTTEQIRRAVVEVGIPDLGTGSGFFISEDGLLVTNYHVAGGADEVELRFDGSTETTSAKVLGGSACADIALIQAEGGPYEYLEWAPDVPKLEEAIRVVGFPRGTQTISFQDGRVSKEISDDIEVGGFLTNFESSARTDFGNSGGPVVNSIGEVLGVHYAAEWGNPRHLAGVEAREVVDSILTGTVIDPGFQIINAYRRTLDGVTGNTLDIGTVRPGSPADTLGLGFGDEIVVFDGIVPQDDFGGARMVCDAILDNAGRTPMDIVVYRWQDETLWDGQLFGEPLTMRPDPYVLGTDDGSIAVTVPGHWTDKKDIEEPGRDWVGYWAAPRLEGDGGYFDAFGRSPGMRLMWSAEKANTHTSAQHLEGLSYAAQASGPIAPFAANGLTGHFQRFSFGGKAAVEYAFTLDGVEDSPLFMLFVADAAHRIDVTVGRMLDTLQFTMPEPDSDG